MLARVREGVGFLGLIIYVRVIFYVNVVLRRRYLVMGVEILFVLELDGGIRML